MLSDPVVCRRKCRRRFGSSVGCPIQWHNPGYGAVQRAVGQNASLIYAASRGYPAASDGGDGARKCCEQAFAFIVVTFIGVTELCARIDPRLYYIDLPVETNEKPAGL